MAPVTISPRQETLLCFLGCAPPKKALDPLRIVKGLFIISQELDLEDLPQGSRYSFIPYDYGPFSVDIYDDLDDLRACGLLEATEVGGRSWKLHSLSEEGRTYLQGVRETFGEKALRYLQAVYLWVSSQSFSDLLKSVYAKYPDFASESVFRPRPKTDPE